MSWSIKPVFQKVISFQECKGLRWNHYSPWTRKRSAHCFTATLVQWRLSVTTLYVRICRAKKNYSHPIERFWLSCGNKVMHKWNKEQDDACLLTGFTIKYLKGVPCIFVRPLDPVGKKFHLKSLTSRICKMLSERYLWLFVYVPVGRFALQV